MWYFFKSVLFQSVFNKYYLSKVYFGKMFLTCMSSKLCEFIFITTKTSRVKKSSRQQCYLAPLVIADQDQSHAHLGCDDVMMLQINVMCGGLSDAQA